jgi:hypothetical protein
MVHLHIDYGFGMDVYGLRLSFIYTYASDPLIFKYLSPIASNLPFSKSWVKLRSPIRVLRVCWACDISGRQINEKHISILMIVVFMSFLLIIKVPGSAFPVQG